MITRSVAQLLAEHVTLDVEGIDEWDLYTMCKLCGDWKTILIDFSPELIPACLGQNQCPQT